MTEITPDDLPAFCGKVADRGAPATAIHVRDIVKQIYAFAVLHNAKVASPAMGKQLEHVAPLTSVR